MTIHKDKGLWLFCDSLELSCWRDAPSDERMFQATATNSRALFRLTRIRKSSFPLTWGNTGVHYLTSSIPMEPRSHFGSLLFAGVSSSLVSGILGYTLSNRSPDHDYLESPQYGSPRDFKNGIKELRDVFSQREIVSTDPEVLKIHGFSTMNSYHPGQWDHLSTR